MTVVHPGALVDIAAGDSISKEARLASTSEQADGVCAGGVRAAVVSSEGTLVHI